jgi:hypothetical protein
VRGGQCGALDNSVICLPKTGQSICYDTAGNQISCDGTGQDGEIQAGVAWPNPRFTDHGNSTVTDNLTGLIWAKDANLSGYVKMTWQQALDYVAGMNAGTYQNFGYTDWRLPNIIELKSLVDYSQYRPILPIGHPFINVQTNDFYWSSTTVAGSKALAWVITTSRGQVGYADKANIDFYFYVWPVCNVQGSVTVITLSAFIVQAKSGQVIIEWSTESEIDNVGFNLYRSEAENGNYTKINASLVSAKGSATQGASYEFKDNNVQNRKTYYYKLEDIDLSGNSNMHGPESVTLRWWMVK